MASSTRPAHLGSATAALAASLALVCPGASGQKTATIHAAAQQGDLAAVRQMLERDARRAHALDGSQRTALHLAARYGHVEIVDLLLARGAAASPQAYNKFTPLHLAASFGRTAVVERLIEAGADLAAADASGGTPVRSAAFLGHRAVVDRLRKAGAPYDLGSAAELGDVAGVRTLLGKPRADKFEVEYAMQAAARKGHADVAGVLLAAGAPLRGSGPWGMPFLLVGIRHPKIVACLLDAGAKVDERMHVKGLPDGATPLHAAVFRGALASARILLDKGAELEAETTAGLTPLLLAASRGERTCVAFLLQRKANARARSEAGHNAIRLTADGMGPSATSAAPNRERTAIVALLAARGVQNDLRSAIALGDDKTATRLLTADLNQVRGKDGRTDGELLLHHAVKFGRKTMVDRLLVAGADPEARDASDYAALHWAAFWRRPSIAALLLERGAEAAAKTKSGWTPLHECGRVGALEVARILLDAGADANARDDRGQTPLQAAAAAAKSSELTALLRGRR